MITTQPSLAAQRWDRALTSCAAQKRSALGLYLPVGYPNLRVSRRALHKVAQHVHFLKLGIPHTDPHLDGREIRGAVAQSLQGGCTMRDVFITARDLADATDVALIAMSYWKPITHYGVQDFAKHASASGIGAVLVADLPIDSPAEADWLRAAQKAGLYTIPLIPQTASCDHLAAIAHSTRGPVYLAARSGQSGSIGPLPSGLPDRIRGVRAATGRRVLVGRGLSNPRVAAQAAVFADAVVIGSAVIRCMRTQPASAAQAAEKASMDFANTVRRAHQLR
ncbi:tryptophan synthase subunit alpha [Streptomyces sp. NPDC020707]|uniref:tryptophan synthase subunit alpha n=1 Tax=Streptomyces sp. NPDC020707 TaxID=3365084 RepID=UPI0037B97E33